MYSTVPPRSVRNNNPGNIRVGQHWCGLMPREKMNAMQVAEAAFAVFDEPKWGFRAMAILLRNYAIMYGCTTVEQFIHKWAPPGENDTEAYVRAVAGDLSCASDHPVYLDNPLTVECMIKAMTKHETGYWDPWWKDEDLKEGVALAKMGEG